MNAQPVVTSGRLTRWTKHLYTYVDNNIADAQFEATGSVGEAICPATRKPIRGVELRSRRKWPGCHLSMSPRWHQIVEPRTSPRRSAGDVRGPAGLERRKREGETTTMMRKP